MSTKFFATTVLSESDPISAGPASIREVSGFNDGAVTLYFMLINKAGALANGDQAALSARVPSGATFRGDFRDMLRSFADRIQFAFSTTPETLTLGAGAIGWVEAVYED
jgi:hypothetical protein